MRWRESHQREEEDEVERKSSERGEEEGEVERKLSERGEGRKKRGGGGYIDQSQLPRLPSAVGLLLGCNIL